MASCIRCKRELRDRESIARGYGPVCWRRLQVANGSCEADGGAGVYDGGDIVLRRVDGRPTTNVPRQVVYHSPSGFEWGYGGSGPADLALNILLLFTDEATARQLYQDFKWEFVARVPREGGVIERERVVRFIKERRQSA